ncbi:hypothetical protein CR513_13083, partial [Mucuna pruriens]
MSTLMHLTSTLSLYEMDKKILPYKHLWTTPPFISLWTPLILSQYLERNDQSFSFNKSSLKTYSLRPYSALPFYTFEFVPPPSYPLLATYSPPKPITPHPWETLFQAYLHPAEPLTSPY